MRKLHLVASLTLLASGTVAAQAPRTVPQPKPGEQVTVVGDQPERSKLICESFIPTGSIKSEKICKTKAEFEQIRTDNLNDLQRWKDRQEIMWNICRNRDPPSC
jgi:hypothetical protein